MTIFYLEQLRRAQEITAMDRDDWRHVHHDITDTPCTGHLLPWLSARCIRCGEPTARETA